VELVIDTKPTKEHKLSSVSDVSRWALSAIFALSVGKFFLEVLGVSIEWPTMFPGIFNAAKIRKAAHGQPFFQIILSA